MGEPRLQKPTAKKKSLHIHGCLAIFKTLDFAERNRWFGGVPGTHGDHPVMFSTYNYGLFKS